MTSLDATPTLAKKAVNSQWYEELKKTFDEGYSWVSFNLLQSVQSCGRRQLCTYEKCYLQQLRYQQARRNIKYILKRPRKFEKMSCFVLTLIKQFQKNVGDFFSNFVSISSFEIYGNSSDNLSPLTFGRFIIYIPISAQAW